MLLLPITMAVIKICVANNKEISECTWITCMLPKVCQRVNDIVSCVIPNDTMKVSSESVLSTNYMNPITESLLTESVSHSSPIPDSPSLSSLISGTEPFPSSETMTKQRPLLGDTGIEVEPEENFTVKTLPEVCWFPAVTGPCSKTKILWYYNSLTGRCERFSFSGCGNANHFYTRKECEETCLVEYPNTFSNS